MTTPGWRGSWRKRLEIALIAGIGTPLLMLLRLTLRWHVEGAAYLDAVDQAGTPPIVGFWHGRILAGMFFFRRRGLVVLTSQNFDGEWIARVIRRFGFGAARGSSSRNAAAALKALVRHLRSGRGVALTLDGPRGPAMSAKPGAVWLASMTGSPILPFHLEADRGWTVRSWDATQIPKPFSTVYLVIGEPVAIPGGLDAAAIEQWRLVLEHRLAILAERAHLLAGPRG